MSDRFQSLVVALEHDMTEEELEPIVTALRMTRGVASIHFGDVADVDVHLARARLSFEMKWKLIDAISNIFDGKEPDAKR